jgi:hypothetical protein
MAATTADDYDHLTARVKRDIDPRVLTTSPWTIVNESTVPITIFSAS